MTLATQVPNHMEQILIPLGQLEPSLNAYDEKLYMF